MKNSFRIAEISYGLPFRDKSYEFDYRGNHFDVQIYSADFRTDYFIKLIRQFRNDVDAFAFTNLPPMMRLEGRNYIPKAYLEIMNTPASVPMCDGAYLRDLMNLNQLRTLIDERQVQLEDGVLFPSAVLNLELAEFVRKYANTNNVYFADLHTLFGLPVFLKPFLGLKTLAKVAFTLANLKDLGPADLRNSAITKQLGLQLQSEKVEHCRYVIGDLSLLMFANHLWPMFKNKEVITWSYDEQHERRLKELGVKKVINLIPEKYNIAPAMNYAVMDAAFRLTRNKFGSLSVPEWEHALKITPQQSAIIKPYFTTTQESVSVKVTKGIEKIKQKVFSQEPVDFAFVVHALSHEDLLKAPGMGVFKLLPESMEYNFDKTLGKLPGFVYGRVKHVISEKTGKEVNGIIYGLTATPKVLKESDPQEIYQKIERLTYHAYGQGAKIFGLGAYTKIVGDSGITINQNSPIPVTTGNSLSASTTLWALHEAMKKMNLVHIDDETGFVDGSAMVIGATGSIGKVSAKLLALAFKKLYIVAPRLERLEQLKEEIVAINPRCEVIVATDANEFAGQVDALVTATSAFDQKIVDVERLKPGCVVCDCSRPLDFTKEDARKRPDVLIIESGEVILPGPSEVSCDIGLPGNVVYACLAETALLALEEKYEPFTLGRDIDWEKVKIIYKMAIKHGVKLDTIQGHFGPISDREIEMIRSNVLRQQEQKQR